MSWKHRVGRIRRLAVEQLKKEGLKPFHRNPIGQVIPTTLGLRDMIFGRLSYAQQGEDLTLDRILHRLLGFNLRTYKGTYVDAGAYHPISYSTTYHLYKRNWKGVCIDPSVSSCRLLGKIRPRDLVINAATGAFDGQVPFEQQAQPSLIQKVDMEPDKTTSSEATMIEVVTINTALKRAGFTERLDYLNVDTEGAELETLLGLDFDLYAPRVISIEIHARGIREALESEVAVFLEQQGYTCVASNVITFFFVRE